MSLSKNKAFRQSCWNTDIFKASWELHFWLVSSGNDVQLHGWYLCHDVSPVMIHASWCHCLCHDGEACVIILVLCNAVNVCVVVSVWCHHADGCVDVYLQPCISQVAIYMVLSWPMLSIVPLYNSLVHTPFPTQPVCLYSGKICSCLLLVCSLQLATEGIPTAGYLSPDPCWHSPMVPRHQPITNSTNAMVLFLQFTRWTSQCISKDQSLSLVALAQSSKSQVWKSLREFARNSLKRGCGRTPALGTVDDVISCWCGEHWWLMYGSGNLAWKTAVSLVFGMENRSLV